MRLLLVSTPPIYSQECSTFEKIRDVYPGDMDVDLSTANGIRFCAAETRPVSNYVKEKRSINE